MAVIIFFLHLHHKHNSVGHSIMARIMQLDLLGTAIFIPAIICLLLALQWGGADYPWNNSRIIGLFVGFGVMILIFIGIQLKKGDKGTLPPGLFTNRNVLFAMLFAFFFGAAFFPLIYYLCTYQDRGHPVWIIKGYDEQLQFANKKPALYFQAIQGVSAVQAGIKILPLLIAVVVTSMVSGGLITAIGYYNPIVIPSMILFAVGAGMITTFDVDSPMKVWFGYQVLCGMYLTLFSTTPPPLPFSPSFPDTNSPPSPRSRHWYRLPNRSSGRPNRSPHGDGPHRYRLCAILPDFWRRNYDRRRANRLPKWAH